MKRKLTPHRRKGYKRRPLFPLTYCGTPFIGFDPAPKGDRTGIIVIDIDFSKVESRVLSDLAAKMRGIKAHLITHPLLGCATVYRPGSTEDFWKGVFPPISFDLEELRINLPPGATSSMMDDFLREAGIPEKLINPPEDEIPQAPGEEFHKLGRCEVCGDPLTLSPGWVPSYSDPDNRGCLPEAEPYCQRCECHKRRITQP